MKKFLPFLLSFLLIAPQESWGASKTDTALATDKVCVGASDTACTGAELVFNSSGTSVITTPIQMATVDINGGTMDGTKIGASSSADATFNVAAASQVYAVSGFFTNATVASGLATDFAVTSLTANNGTLVSADINGGTIDGTRIGSSSAADATFSAATVTGTMTARTLAQIDTGNVPFLIFHVLPYDYSVSLSNNAYFLNIS